MNDTPARGRVVDIMLHQVFVDGIQREHDDLDVRELDGLQPKTPSYRVTINGATITGVRALHVQLHDPELTRPEDPDPRAEIMKHWGRDPELIIAAWHADRSGLQHLAKRHEERANELAADLDHAERENRRLTAIDTKARPRRYWASHVFAAETARRVHPAHRGE